MSKPKDESDARTPEWKETAGNISLGRQDAKSVEPTCPTCAVLREALEKIDAIRNTIIGRQGINWSRDIYPLVAALEAAGFHGIGYDKAREEALTLNQHIDNLEAALKEAREERDEALNHAKGLAEVAMERALEWDKSKASGLELELRQEWWTKHGCPFSGLYGDDGEMQCHACAMDFKRTPMDQLRTHVYERRLMVARAALGGFGKPSNAT